MTSTDVRAFARELAPVREALLAAARAQAAQVGAAADAEAAQVLAGAQAQADALCARAREQGTADATSTVMRDRARARREARTVVLSARREAYELLMLDARAAVGALAAEPGYAALRDTLTAAARQALGPRAKIRDADGGGILAETADGAASTWD